MLALKLIQYFLCDFYRVNTYKKNIKSLSFLYTNKANAMGGISPKKNADLTHFLKEGICGIILKFAI